jgi:hypothetical protein
MRAVFSAGAMFLTAAFIWPERGSARAAIEISRQAADVVQVVVPDRASPPEQFAALELSNYLHRIVGVAAPVLTESRAGRGPRLLVGRTRAARSALRALASEDPDAFVVRQRGRDLILAGASGRGTIYAVYDLLERELGCRWLAPGTVWEEVPRADRVLLAPAPRLERPAFRYRYERMTYLPGRGAWEEACLQWAVRQRINVGCEWPADRSLALRDAPWGGFRAFMWPHSLPFLTDWNKLREQHPDWFALVNGRRKTDAPPSHSNLCTTEPAVIEFVARVLGDAFDAQPDLELLPLGPGDGVAFCECDRCRALDTGDTWTYSGRTYPGLSDRWLTFVNAVAERLARSHPGKKIYTLAYHQTFAPPRRVRPRPNVMIQVVNSRPEGVCFVHPVTQPGCTNNALFRRNFEAWTAITPGGTLAYQYMPHSTFCGMPLPAPQKFMADIRWLHRAGCIGYEGQSQPRLFGLFGISLYAAAKAMWNPQREPEALLQDYCDAAFREASAPMQSFFRAFARGQERAAHTDTGVWTAVTPEVLAEAGRWMHEAQSRATNAIVKRRLAGLNAHLRFAERGREVYDRAQAAARQRNPAELERAKTLAAQAHRELEAAREADPQAVILSFEVNPFDRLLRERDPR